LVRNKPLHHLAPIMRKRIYHAAAYALMVAPDDYTIAFCGR
jgi:hypothetical protein